MSVRQGYSGIVPSARQQGAGLVEILVALSIGLVLLSGFIKIFISSKQTYRYQLALANVQENGRIALTVLKRNVRMASNMGGCAGNKPLASVSIPAAPAAVGTIRNTLCPTTNYSLQLGTPIEGYQATSSGWTPSLPSALASEGIVAGTDAFTVRGMQDINVVVTKQPSLESADLQVANNKLIAAGDVLLVVDRSCSRGAIFQVTNYNANANNFDNIVHNENTGGNCKSSSPSPGNQTKNLGADFTGGHIYVQSTRSYFLKKNSSGERALYEKVGDGSAQELVDGIENFQVTYGVDSGSGIQYVPAGKGTDWRSVMSVRINLLLRSSADNVVQSPMSVFFAGSMWSSSDRRLYQAVSTTISIRNRAL